MRYTYTKTRFIEAVKTSLSIADVCRKLGVKPAGGNYHTINKKIKEFSLDISHFTGRGWNTGDRYKPINPPKPLKDLLVLSDTAMASHSLRLRILSAGVKRNVCDECGIKDWLGKKITMELHHVNGNPLDNRIENIQILCPNCHSQTENYRGRKRKKKRKVKYKHSKKCIDCGAKIGLKSKRCTECSKIKSRKIKDRPTKEQLIEEIQSSSYVAVGKKYGVSDNAIRKWLK